MKNNEFETMTHPLITKEHLKRKAIVYVRRSSLGKLDTTACDQHYRELARQYGWPDDLIEVIDDDLGKSSSSVSDRRGWQRMWEQIIAGDVGAIFAASVSRLSRQRTSYEQLLSLASDHGTLLYVDDAIMDPCIKD